jgi:hypothetical protein
LISAGITFVDLVEADHALCENPENMRGYSGYDRNGFTLNTCVETVGVVASRSRARAFLGKSFL